MSKHNIPDDNPLKRYTVIEPDDSGSEIITKMYNASDEDLHNIPKNMEDGYDEAFEDGVRNTLVAFAILGGVVGGIYGAYQSFIKPKMIEHKQHKAQKQLQAAAGQNKQLPAPETDTIDVDCEESESTSDDE